MHAPAIQETVREFRRFVRRTIVPSVEKIEQEQEPGPYRTALDEILAFGLLDAEKPVEGDPGGADEFLSELLFALGEETLSGALGIGLIAILLSSRLRGTTARSDVYSTYPLFLEHEPGEASADRPARLPLVPLAGWATEVCWPSFDRRRLLRLPLADAQKGRMGPVRTLGLRGCPLYDVALEEDGGLGGPESDPVSPPAVEAALQSARRWTLALAAGIFSGGLSRAAAYASERYQGGQVIIRHSGLRAILSRLQATLHRAESAFRHPLLAPGAVQEGGSSLRPLFADAMESLADQSQFIVQVFGGYGYMEDFGVERVYRDVTTLAVAFGRRGFDWVDSPASGIMRPGTE